MSDRIAFRRQAGDGPEAEPPSKTGLKKQMHELQALGEQLVALPADRLAAIELGDTLRDAIETARRTRSHEGLRRQMQYVGKLMRGVDAEPIREALARFALGAAEDSLQLHTIEAWREDLIRSEDAITRWMQEHPGTDVKRLRELVRGARADLATPPESRHGTAYRKLFQFIKPFIQGAAEQ